MKCRAFAGHAFQRNASSMREDDIFDDREAETGAAGVARAVFMDIQVNKVMKKIGLSDAR